jgi:S-adenosylmethionine synthetase
VVIAASHDDNVSEKRVAHDVIGQVIKPVAGKYLDNKTKFFINATGRFVKCGPPADAGLTGRKIIVDTYGGQGSHGGGCFSGKDPSKVDRSASYMARYVAKNLVAAGIADRLELQIAYVIGVAQPISILVDTFGTGQIAQEKIVKLIRKYFDLTPAGIIKKLKLLRPIYKKTAVYGHFGRTEPEFYWEKTDLVNTLRRAAGL